MNSWMTHLAQEVACWVQMRSQGEKVRSLPFDLWMGWVMGKGVLEESGWRTGSVGDVHWVPYLMGMAGCGRFGVSVEEAVEGDKEHLEGVRDGWKRRKERAQEADLGLHDFGTEQTLAGLSLFLCLWARTGSGGEGDGFLQALNTLVPGLESPQGG